MTKRYVHIWGQGQELLKTVYSDATPAVVFTNSAATNYNRSGLPQLVQDASGIWRLEYDHAARLTAAVCTNGLFSGLTVSNRFDGLHGRDQIRVLGASPTLTHSFGYDGYPDCLRIKRRNGRAAETDRSRTVLGYGLCAVVDRPWSRTNCGCNQVMDLTRTWTDRVCGRSADATRVLPGNCAAYTVNARTIPRLLRG